MLNSIIEHARSMVVSEKPKNNRVGALIFFNMKKKENQRFALQLNKKAVANIKGGATSDADADAAAGSGQAKNTCQWSSCDNCHSWKCNIS